MTDTRKNQDVDDTDEQIIGFLLQVEAGMALKELCRKHGFSDASFYKWKAKYGGIHVSDARRLKELESENGKLKKLLAEAHLDTHGLTNVFGTRWWGGGHAGSRTIGSSSLLFFR